MGVLLLGILIAATAESLWSFQSALRPHRAHFRAMLALFWGTVFAIYAADAMNVVPSLYFQRIPRFASDAATYQQQARVLADALRGGATSVFVDPQYFNYPRILSVLYVVFGEHALIGNVFNAVFYMASLVSIFCIGRLLFSDRAGLLAAWTFACLPTFLLHDTQTLRWAMTTAALHVATAGTVMLISSRHRWLGFFLAACGFGGLLYDLPYIARLYMMILAACACFALINPAPWRPRLLAAARILALALVATIWYQATWASATPKDVQITMQRLRGRPMVAPEPAGNNSAHVSDQQTTGSETQSHAPTSVFDRMTTRLDALIAPALLARRGFIGEAEAVRRDGHSVGTALSGPTLLTFGDFVRNLPSAYWTALVEPTIPRLLDQTTGSSGVAGVAAFEVFVHYVLLSVSIAGLAIALRLKGLLRVQVVLIVMLTCAAYALIGTTILNGGTLHRLRQPYIAFHCIFAAAAVLSAWDHRVAHKRAGSALTKPEARLVH